MTEAELLTRLETALQPLGGERLPGFDYTEPWLSELAVFARPVRLSRVPILGRGLSVVSVIAVPDEAAVPATAWADWYRRAGRAACHRFPPYRGASIGLTTVLVGTNPVQPDDDRRLAEVLQAASEARVVALGLFRLDLEQRQMAGALRRGPDGLYPEPEVVHDLLIEDFGRFLPLVDG